MNYRTWRIAPLIFLITLVWNLGCQSPYARQDPTGEYFPAVQGTSLEGEIVSIPSAWAGEKVLLLVGFEQNTQFDLDRWALALIQSGLRVRAVEIPTIRGLVPSLISDRIDAGMRRGIPEEAWASVITVYRDADAIARFTGNTNPLPGRILLIDAEGRVIFFHDRGFSTTALSNLAEAGGLTLN